MKVPVARPIEDVIADLRTKLVRMLPGSQAVRAAWGTLNQADRMMTHARHILDEMQDRSEPRVFISHGETYACATIIRSLADAFKIPNVTWREVSDVHDQPARADDGDGQHPGVVDGLGADVPVAA